MLVLALIGAAALIGAGVTAAIRRWPAKDPAAPRLSTAEVEVVVHRHPRLRDLLRSRLDPARATGLALTIAVVVIVVTVSALGVLAAMVRANRGLANYDVRISTFAAAHATSSSTRTLRLITQLGGAVVLVPLAALVAALEFKRVRSRSVWIFSVLVVGGQFFLANSIKLLVDRARPAFDQLSGFSGTSFPSGHATASAAGFAAFALLAGRRRSVNAKAALAGVAVALAIVVAGTRVLLGVHWLTDAVAGLFLGWGWFALCSLAFGGRLLRFGLPVAIAEDVATHQST